MLSRRKYPLRWRRSVADAARAAQLFFAASDPVRIHILAFLAHRQDACVTDIASALGMSVAAVSHHLQRLRASGCLTAYRTGRNICYEFTPNRFTDFVLREAAERRKRSV